MTDSRQEFRVGVGRAIVSPENPELLQPTGMTRLIPTRGILDDLTVEAIAVDDGSGPAFILSGDLRRLEYDWLVRVRQRVGEETGADPSRILFSCTHCHCSNPIPADESHHAQASAAEAVEKIVRGIGEACLSAHADLRPAELGRFTARLRRPVGQVRRMKLGNGTVVQCWGSGPVVAPGVKLVGEAGEGPREIAGLVFRDAGTRRPFALLTSYSAHPHLYELPYFSGEIGGAVKREMERRLPGILHVYGNGTPGDIDIHCVHPMPSEEEDAIKWFQDSCREVAQSFAEAVGEAVASVADSEYSSAIRVLHRYWSHCEGESDPPERMVILNTLVIGGTAIVSLPGELFHAYGTLIRERNPFDHLLLMGYNGSAQGYVPTPLAFEEGGYEAMRGPATSRTDEAVPMQPGSPNLRARLETGQEIGERIIRILCSLH